MAGGLLLTFHDIRAESVSSVLLGCTAWLIGVFYKYSLLAAATVRLHNQVITDPVSGVFTTRYFRLRLQTEWSSNRRTKKPLSLLMLQMAEPSELVQGLSWEEVQKQVRSIVDAIRELKPSRGFIGRLSENRFGILLPNQQISQARESAVRLQDALRSSLHGAFVMGLACTEQTPMHSGEDLFRCAEAALLRATAEREVQTLKTFDSAIDKISFEKAVDRQGQGEATPLEYVASELDEKNRVLEKALSELKKTHEQLESAFLEVTKSLVLALETKDAYTAGHLERVSRYANRLAETLDLPKQEIEAIREAALLHDIGKIGLPDEVLHKVGKLTDEEKDIIKQHLMIGAKILEPMKFFKSITTLIYHHHEWYNGQGYPHGLAGEFIPAGAQVIAIADSFDAMTTHRGYNKPRSVQEALAELARGANTQFNPRYVDKFIEVVSREGPQLSGKPTA
jgi:putative nucleotidyltransferase with HDIG domain